MGIILARGREILTSLQGESTVAKVDLRGSAGGLGRQVGGSRENALDVHVEEQIYEYGEGQEPDGDEGNEIYFASDGLQVFQ